MGGACVAGLEARCLASNEKGGEKMEEVLANYHAGLNNSVE